MGADAEISEIDTLQPGTARSHGGSRGKSLRPPVAAPGRPTRVFGAV